MTWTVWDRRMAARALASSLVAAGLALVVVAATDEGAGAPARLALLGALAPALGALGTMAATRIADARGELRALEALGGAPLRARRGAIVGGAIVALAGAGAASFGDLRALLPRPVTPVAWVVEGDGGSVVEPALGLRVARDGTPSLLAPPEAGAAGPVPPALAPSARGWIAAALVVAAAAPAWVVSRGSAARKVLTAFVVVVGLVVAFQAVAAGRLPPIGLVVPPIPMLVEALLALRREAAPRSSRRATIAGVVP